jgi:hypothetical protein
MNRAPTTGKAGPKCSAWTQSLGFQGDGEIANAGDPSADRRSYKVIDDHTLLAAGKKGGKKTNTACIVLSADGKTRTVALSGTDASGAKITSTQIYDRQ